MFLFAHIDSITLPLEDPILKFLLILVIILAAPLLLNKLKIPYLLGLIIAGAVIGPHGLNLVLRDSSIILSGTAGLLYIMFLSGLDMDMSDFKKNSWRSLIFGLYTFCVPLGLGILAGYYILGFPIYSSILLAGLFASQTLIAYPIVSKLGISRDKAVTIAVGGTVITDTLALLLLTVIVGMSTKHSGGGSAPRYCSRSASSCSCSRCWRTGFSNIAATAYRSISSCWRWYSWEPISRTWPGWSRSSVHSSRGWPSTARSPAPRP